MTGPHITVDTTFADLREAAQDDVHLNHLCDRLQGLETRLSRIEMDDEVLAADIAYLHACYSQARREFDR